MYIYIYVYIYRYFFSFGIQTTHTHTHSTCMRVEGISYTYWPCKTHRQAEEQTHRYTHRERDTGTQNL